jgi:hypothetical protein
VNRRLRCRCEIVIIIIIIITCIIITIIILLQLGVHPVAVDLTLITDREIGLYTKGTIQNKVHTVNKVHRMQIQIRVYTVVQGHVIHLSSNLILFASLHSNKVTSH